MNWLELRRPLLNTTISIIIITLASLIVEEVLKNKVSHEDIWLTAGIVLALASVG